MSERRKKSVGILDYYISPNILSVLLHVYRTGSLFVTSYLPLLVIYKSASLRHLCIGFTFKSEYFNNPKGIYVKESY